MNYKHSVKKIQAGIEEKLVHQFGEKAETASDVQYYKAVALMVKENADGGSQRIFKPCAEIKKDLLSLYGIFNGSFPEK